MRELKLVGADNIAVHSICTPMSFPLTEEDLDDIRSVKAQMVIDNPKCQGISANQYGIMKRFCFTKFGVTPAVLINPEVISQASVKQKSIESCMTTDAGPGILDYYTVLRPFNAVIGYLDINGVKKKAVPNSQKTRIYMHEIDHLNGILITDTGIFYERRYRKG